MMGWMAPLRHLGAKVPVGRNRREVITLLGGVAAVWPVAAQAQQPVGRARIGVLANLPLPPLNRFSRKMHELGYIEGQDLRFNIVLRKATTSAILSWPPSWWRYPSM